MAAIVINLVFLGVALKFIKDAVFGIVGWLVFEVPYVATAGWVRREVVKRVVMREGERLVELGSGEGRVTLEFVKKYPIEAVGVDLAWWLLLSARLKTWLTVFKKGKVRWVRQDFFESDLRKADVVYVYLLTSVIDRLRPKLEGELKKGARVVSWVYPLSSPSFTLVEEFGGRNKMRVYRKIK